PAKIFREFALTIGLLPDCSSGQSREGKQLYPPGKSEANPQEILQFIPFGQGKVVIFSSHPCDVWRQDRQAWPALRNRVPFTWVARRLASEGAKAPVASRRWL